MDIYEMQIEYNDGVLTIKDFIEALEKACNFYNIDFNCLNDIETVSSNLFNNILLGYVNHILLKPTKALYNDNYIHPVYDKDKIIIMVNIYIYLCNLYDKGINLCGLVNLCGLDSSTLYQNNNNGLNTIKNQISKMILNADNERQKQRAQDSKQAILNLAYNNYMHGWNGEIKANEIKTSVKTLEDIKADRLKIEEK